MSIHDSAKRRRRRLRLVCPGPQLKFIALAVLTVFAISAVITAQIFNALYLHARSLAVAMPGQEPETARILVSQALLSSLAPAVMVAFFALLISNRIFGPLRVLERMAKDIAEGRSPERRALRKRDEFQVLHALLCKIADRQANTTPSDNPDTTALHDQETRMREQPKLQEVR